MKKRIISTLLAAMMIFSVTGTNSYASAATNDDSESSMFDGDVSYQLKQDPDTEDGQELLDNPLPRDYFDDVNNQPVDYNYQGTISGHTPRKLTSAGKLNNIVIFIKFKGESDSAVYPKSTIDSIMETYNGDSYSLKDYYNHVSGGKVDVNGIFPQVNGDNVFIYEAPEDYKAYATNSYLGKAMLKEAFRSVKDKVGSDVNVDADNDGDLDAVSFFVTHQANHADFLWPHAWSVTRDTETMINGAYLYKYNLFTTSYFSGAGYRLLTHEFGHTLGFPDYYRGSSDTSLMGNWTMMCNNSGYQTVYERSKYTTWVNEDQIPVITGSGTYEISDSTQDPSENTIGYKIDVGHSRQSFMIEYRNKNANIYESRIPNSGLLVSRVKPDQDGNYYADKEEVMLSNGYVNEAALNDSSANKTIKLLLEDGTDTGYAVTYVSTSDGKIKFTVSCKGENPISYNNLTVGKSTANTGDSIVLTSDATGGNGSLSYKFSYILNGEETIIRDYNSSNTFTWKPSKPGTYTIKGYVTDGKKTEEKTSNSIVVSGEEITETKATIYYNKKSNLTGSNVYIHYNKNGQGWTKVPGELMTPTTEKAGYNYKATIDLSSIDGSMVFCFNDGNNHWDSRNGGNYECKTGTYGVSNEVTQKLKTDFTVDSFKTSFSQSTVTGTVGISATTSNGSGVVNYRFTAIDANGTETVIKDYSTSSSVNWRTMTEGNYTLKVQAKDGSNKIISKTIPFNVVKMATVTGTFDKQSPQEFGSTIKVSLNATGGTGNLEYQLIAQGGNYQYTGKEIYIQKFSANKVINWTPDMDGTYVLLADVKDATGAINRVSLGNYTFNKNLVISSFTSNKPSPQVVGRIMTLTATTKNETGNVQYSFSFQKKDGVLTDILVDSQLNTCTWMPETAGEYTLFVNVKDASGNTATKSMTFTVANCLRISSFTSDKKSPQPANTKITLDTNVTGGIGTVQYRYTFKTWNGISTVIRDYSSDSSFTWTPKEEMVGYVIVEAKDESGDSATGAQMDYSIEKSKDNIVTIYYKSSWSKAYCHYKVNGQWTSVPGKEMTKIASIDGGYNYKLEINLGTTSKITCCFNNGNGQWDSKNGANYSASDCANKNLGVKDQSIKEITVGPQTISISSLVATPSELELGSKVQVKATTINATGKVGYTFTILKDGKEISSNYNYDGVYNYIPVAEGTYTVKVVAEDTANKTTEKTCTFTVGKKIESNKVTIYYKGYNNPNIHYQKTDGTWTSVPGIKMTLASNGYYTITIDIQKATKLVCCFNDGNGHWDSRNGQNYTFNVGTSYFKGGVIQSNPF